MGDEALVKQRFAQNMPNTCGLGTRRDLFVRVTCNKNNRSVYALVSQPVGQIDAVDFGHFVVDHKAIDVAWLNCAEQRRAGSEGSSFEPVCFEKKLQRSENVGIVVDHINGGFFGWRHHECLRIFG
jgi:hypothetical protein